MQLRTFVQPAAYQAQLVDSPLKHGRASVHLHRACLETGRGFCDSKKMTFLENFDTYFMIFNICCQYLIKFDQIW